MASSASRQTRVDCRDETEWSGNLPRRIGSSTRPAPLSADATLVLAGAAGDVLPQLVPASADVR